MENYITKRWVCLALFSAILCITSAADDKVHLHIPRPIVEGLRLQSKVCSKEWGLPPETIRKLIDWTMPDEKTHKSFLFCVLNSMGYFDDKGHYVVDSMMVLQPRNGSREDFAKYLEECNKVTLDDPADTLFEGCNCLYKSYLTLP